MCWGGGERDGMGENVSVCEAYDIWRPMRHPEEPPCRADFASGCCGVLDTPAFPSPLLGAACRAPSKLPVNNQDEWREGGRMTGAFSLCYHVPTYTSDVNASLSATSLEYWSDFDRFTSSSNGIFARVHLPALNYVGSHRDNDSVAQRYTCNVRVGSEGKMQQYEDL